MKNAENRNVPAGLFMGYGVVISLKSLANFVFLKRGGKKKDVTEYPRTTRVRSPRQCNGATGKLYSPVRLQRR